MSATTARALRLLSLLQTHRHWTGPELADRLGVTERTVRRDIGRLRELGYRVDSVPGVDGGYRLEAGNGMPPLLLTDDEAVAIAVGLRVASSGRLLRGAETALTALAKLEQVLPARLRRRVQALGETVWPAGIRSGEAVAADVLIDLALACRDHERVAFAYTAASGAATQRRVDPHALVPAERHWYLLAWDRDRDDWRTFRVDRMAEVSSLRTKFVPRPLSRQEIVERVLAGRSSTTSAIDAQVVMALPLADMREHFGRWAGDAVAADDDHTRWPLRSAEARDLMYAMAWVPAGVRYTVDLPEPARAELREIVDRMRDALAAPPQPQARRKRRGRTGSR